MNEDFDIEQNEEIELLRDYDDAMKLLDRYDIPALSTLTSRLTYLLTVLGASK